MTTVRDRVREQPIPGEAEAAARSWPVVEAALAEHLSGEPGVLGAVDYRGNQEEIRPPPH